MCDYCDCRELGPIGQLSADHEEIEELAHRLRVALTTGDEEAAPGALVALGTALAPHLDKEEQGLFLELAERGGFDGYLERLRADHVRARAELIGGHVSPDTTAALLAALDELAAHIEVEEHDLFPASRLLLGDAEWSRVAVVNDTTA